MRERHEKERDMRGSRERETDIERQMRERERERESHYRTAELLDPGLMIMYGMDIAQWNSI